MAKEMSTNEKLRALAKRRRTAKAKKKKTAKKKSNDGILGSFFLNLGKKVGEGITKRAKRNKKDNPIF